LAREGKAELILNNSQCAFLNNCIGHANYLPFLSSLAAAVLSACYSIAFSVYHVYRASTTPGASISTSWETIGALVVAILSFGMLIPVAGLASYHARLCFTNRTTIEMVRFLLLSPPLLPLLIPFPVQLRSVPNRATSFDPATGQPIPGNPWAHASYSSNFVAVACRPERGWEGGLGRKERRKAVGRDARESLDAPGKERE
jgi:hypothetical protein